MPLYVGPGLRLIDYTNGRDDSSFAIGARLVGGLLFDFKEVPLDAFIEVAGVLEYESGDTAASGSSSTPARAFDIISDQLLIRRLLARPTQRRGPAGQPA